MNSGTFLVATALVLALPSCAFLSGAEPKPASEPMSESKLPLGAFSISLAVKDIAASRAFYEKLGFEKMRGNQDQNWLILQNETTTIGLFQGMFQDNLMTFNPGWTSKAETMESFTDIREIQRQLKKSGLKLLSEADESTTGIASFTLNDPDGNTILFDQHVK